MKDQYNLCRCTTGKKKIFKLKNVIFLKHTRASICALLQGTSQSISLLTFMGIFCIQIKLLNAIHYKNDQ